MLLVLAVCAFPPTATAQIPNVASKPPRELGPSGPLYLKAWSLYAAGDYEAAAKLVNETLASDRKAHRIAAEAEGMNLLGTLAYKHGDYSAALPQYRRALALAESVHYSFGVARDLSSLGSTYYRLGNYEQARTYYEESLAMRRKLGDHDEIARALDDLANVHHQLGDFSGALTLRHQALDQFTATHNEVGIADTLNDLGWTADEMGDTAQAIDLYQRSLDIDRKIGLDWGILDCLEGLGTLHGKTGDFAEAEKELSEALAGFEQRNNNDEVSRTLNHLGRLHLTESQSDAAVAEFERAIVIGRVVGNRQQLAESYAGLMQALASQNKSALAIFYGKESIATYQVMRRDISTLETALQRSFVRQKESTYRKLADLLIASGRIAEAQEILDLLKDEEYFDFIRRDQSDNPTEGVRFTKHEAEADAALIAAKQFTAKALAADVQGAFAAVEQKLAVSGTEAPTDTPTMQAVLQAFPKTAAIYTLVTDDQLRLLLITGEGTSTASQTISRQELDGLVTRLRQALQSTAVNPRPLSKRLYSLLLAPFSGQLQKQGVSTILWSLDGPLRYVPMPALFDGEHYLVERYASVVFTPASERYLSSATPTHFTAAAFGVSRPGSGFEPLPNVTAELDAVVSDPTKRTHGALSGRIEEDRAFTTVAFRRQLESGANVIHVATHFVFQPGRVQDSFLLLGDGHRFSLASLRSTPGALHSTELLTLSACETARPGQDAIGKEVDGLAMVAHRKGARSVIASLWPVADASTELLMQQFYRQWVAHSHEGRAEAMRQAQLKLLQGSSPGQGESRFAHPYYWAPFVLFGKWQ